MRISPAPIPSSRLLPHQALKQCPVHLVPSSPPVILDPESICLPEPSPLPV
jgi:hypothetical protein